MTPFDIDSLREHLTVLLADLAKRVDGMERQMVTRDLYDQRHGDLERRLDAYGTRLNVLEGDVTALKASHEGQSAFSARLIAIAAVVISVVAVVVDRLIQ